MQNFNFAGGLDQKLWRHKGTTFDSLVLVKYQSQINETLHAGRY